MPYESRNHPKPDRYNALRARTLQMSMKSAVNPQTCYYDIDSFLFAASEKTCLTQIERFEQFAN